MSANNKNLRQNYIHKFLTEAKLKNYAEKNSIIELSDTILRAENPFVNHDITLKDMSVYTGRSQMIFDSIYDEIEDCLTDADFIKNSDGDWVNH